MPMLRDVWATIEHSASKYIIRPGVRYGSQRRWSTQTVCTFRTTGNVRWLPVQQLDDTDAGDDLGDQPNAAQQQSTASRRVVGFVHYSPRHVKGATDKTAFDARAVGTMRCAMIT